MEVSAKNSKTKVRLMIGLGLVLALLLFVSYSVTQAAAPRNSWTNNNLNFQWSDAGNWTDGVPVAGNVLILDSDASQSDSSGLSTLNNDLSIALKGVYFKGTNSGSDAISVDGSSLSLLPSSQIKSVSAAFGFLDTDVIFQGSGAIRSSSYAAVSSFAPIHHGSNSLYLAAYGNSLQTYNDEFLGTGNLVISGSTNPANFGTVYFNNDVSVAGKTYVRYGGKLKVLNSSLGDLILRSRGTVAPLQCARVNNFTSIDSTFKYSYIGKGDCSFLRRGIFTAPGSTVKIEDSTFDMGISQPFIEPVDVQEKIVVINNGGSRPIFGEFNNAKEGSIIEVDGYSFRVTYKGGTGNDMVLIRQ